MTIVEKIMAKHAGLDSVKPGQLIEAKVDKVLANDITAPIAIKQMRESGVKKVFDKDRVILIPDHFAPNKDIASAEQCKVLREFSREQNLTNYFEVGRMGIEHALLPEQGLVLPGEIIIGADSHTCTHGALGAFATGVGSTDVSAAMISGESWFKIPETIKFVFNGKLNKWVSGKDLILYIIGKIGVDGALYKAMEFAGSTIDDLSMEGRLTIANMAIEAGGKCGIFNPDQKTLDFIKSKTDVHMKLLTGDSDSAIQKVLTEDSDFAVAALPDKTPEKLLFKKITDMHLKFVAPTIPWQYDNLIKNNAIPWDEIPTIVTDRGMARKRIDSWFKNKKTKPNIYAQVSGNESILAMVSMGFGIGIVPELILKENFINRNVQTIDIKPELMPYSVGICVQKKRMANPVVRAFWDKI